MRLSPALLLLWRFAGCLGCAPAADLAAGLRRDGCVLLPAGLLARPAQGGIQHSQRCQLVKRPRTRREDTAPREELLPWSTLLAAACLR